MKKWISKIVANELNRDRKPYGFEHPSWLVDFEKNVEAIQTEWKKYTEINSSGIPIDELSADQSELNYDKKWKSLFLYGYTYFNEKELIYFPMLEKLLKQHKNKITLAMFSTTEAGKHIPPHKGNNSAVIRIQIGVDINNPDLCMLRVEDKKVYLKEKEVFIFDDTFEHELLNESDSNRTVLIIDYYKPLPFFHRLVVKQKMAHVAKSEYVQSVLKKIN